MTARGNLAVFMVVVGLLLMVASYFFFAAPWGDPPSSEEFSNPRVPLAPVIFIAGVITALMSAVVYELLPDKGTDRGAN